MSKCCVLLSTYNGEKFIRQQLESIYLQKTDVEILLYIRDDGSNDRTVEIIREFQENHNDLKIILKKASNIGVQGSFLELLKSAPDADYYAFCDQDDYWHDSKIEIATNKLKEMLNTPSLFYSNFDIVDSDLKFITQSDIVKKKSCSSVTQILFQNKVPGCTMVFNNALLNIINKIDANSVRMHDAYILCVAFIIGKIVSENNSQIMYRQHGCNAVGYYNKFPGLKKWIKKKVALFKNGEGCDLAQTAFAIQSSLEFYCNKKDLNELNIIKSYKSNYISRLKLLFSKKTTSATSLRATLSVKIKIFFGLI